VPPKPPRAALDPILSSGGSASSQRSDRQLTIDVGGWPAQGVGQYWPGISAAKLLRAGEARNRRNTEQYLLSEPLVAPPSAKRDGASSARPERGKDRGHKQSADLWHEDAYCDRKDREGSMIGRRTGPNLQRSGLTSTKLDPNGPKGRDYQSSPMGQK